MSDQDRISPYKINLSLRQVMRIKKNILVLIDPIPNLQYQHHKNCIADSRENN